MRGASKQRVGYKNTNVLRKSLRKRLRLGSRQTGVGEKSSLEGWAQVGGKLMQIRSQTSLAARARARARESTPVGSRLCGPDQPERGGAGESCGRGRVGGRGPRVSVRSGVRGGAAARGSKVHERGGGLQAGPRRRYRRRRGAEADSSGVPGGGGGSDSNPEAARPCSPRPRAPGPGRGAPAAA